MPRPEDNQRLLIAQPYRVHDSVLVAMRTHQRSVAVQQNACWALGNLSVQRTPRVGRSLCPTWFCEATEPIVVSRATQELMCSS